MVPEREGFRNTRKWMDTVYVCAETEGGRNESMDERRCAERERERETKIEKKV